ncbi:MAG: Mur ligase family protein, partial [Bryobacteraceae bacterium]
MKNLGGLKVAVVGMKRSGVAAAELLARNGAVVRAVDEAASGEILPQTIESFEGVDMVVLSPGVPADLPVIEEVRSKGVTVIGEVELASYFLNGPVMGITGSNGKTTTTAMVGHILKESGIAVQVGGNIGLAPTSMTK